ncbi:S-adenosylmethionine:tRNA ribosyltransferase-isomerase [Paenibacillus thiaminolyticus]|nr:S-adenosylmethionine:tRNA ribosyltransferase-isomerase [Paenibacillus thiaminolyticus]
MKVAELDFELPVDLLARRPRKLDGQKRHDSRILVMDRRTNQIHHKIFYDIDEFLDEGDTIVINESKTMNATIFGTVEGLGRLEFALRVNKGDGIWHLDCTPWKEPVIGATIFFDDERLKAKVIGNRSEIGLWIVSFEKHNEFNEIIEHIGRPIISPYVDRIYDNSFYNAIHAITPGSAEMPAAGRHFTEEIFLNLKNKGINKASIILHTGLSSIGLQTENVEEHKMFEEWYQITPENAEIINTTKASGKKVMVIGTTPEKVSCYVFNKCEKLKKKRLKFTKRKKGSSEV